MILSYNYDSPVPYQLWNSIFVTIWHLTAYSLSWLYHLSYSLHAFHSQALLWPQSPGMWTHHYYFMLKERMHACNWNPHYSTAFVAFCPYHPSFIAFAFVVLKHNCCRKVLACQFLIPILCTKKEFMLASETHLLFCNIWVSCWFSLLIANYYAKITIKFICSNEI
jgi:hypothetical protein